LLVREAFRGVAIGAVVLLIAGAIASQAGWADITAPRASGAGAWFVARASGFAAFAALSSDVIVGLIVSTRVADRRLARGQLIELHSWLSPLALALVVGHAVVLLADGYIRFDALDLLIPFVAPYRGIAVGLGVIAAYFAVVVHASFGFRKRLGTKWWRRLHYLSFVAFADGALHGVLAGSDSDRPWAIAVYALPATIVLALVAVRLRGERARPASATPSCASRARVVGPREMASLLQHDAK
jgi:methionine sulfoxide reductase heme-binding subunit